MRDQTGNPNTGKVLLHKKLVQTHFKKVVSYMWDPAVVGLSVKSIENWHF